MSFEQSMREHLEEFSMLQRRVDRLERQLTAYASWLQVALDRLGELDPGETLDDYLEISLDPGPKARGIAFSGTECQFFDYDPPPRVNEEHSNGSSWCIQSSDEVDSETGASLFWSNEHGWVLHGDHDVFKDKDVATMLLPMTGFWVPDGP